MCLCAHIYVYEYVHECIVCTCVYIYIYYTPYLPHTHEHICLKMVGKCVQTNALGLLLLEFTIVTTSEIAAFYQL